MLFFLCAMSSGPSSQADSCTLIRKDVELLELERMLLLLQFWSPWGNMANFWCSQESPCYLPSIFHCEVFVERQRLCIAAFQFCGVIILLEMRRLLCWEATMGGIGILGSVSIVDIHNEEIPVLLIRNALCHRIFFPWQMCRFDKTPTCWIMTQGQAPINSLVYKWRRKQNLPFSLWISKPVLNSLTVISLNSPRRSVGFSSLPLWISALPGKFSRTLV